MIPYSSVSQRSFNASESTKSSGLSRITTTVTYTPRGHHAHIAVSYPWQHGKRFSHRNISCVCTAQSSSMSTMWMPYRQARCPYKDIPSRFQGHKGVKSPRFSISYKGGKVANDFQSGRKAEKSDIRVPILSELMEKHALQPENFLTHKILRTFALARTSEGRCKDTRRQSSDHPTSKCPSTQAYKREY